MNRDIASALDSFRQGQGYTQPQGEESVTSPPQLQGPETEITDVGSLESPASALSLQDRLIFAFGDDRGKEQFLQKRFAVVARDPETGFFMAGNSPDDLLPVDPKGITNDFFGDLADHANLIPLIAAQMMGSAAGAPAGPAGVIAGGAVGAGLGEAANKAIGKAFGVNTQNATEAATDTVISALFGATGEGIGQGLKGAANVMKPAVARFLSKGVSTSPNPSHTLNMLGKIFRFTARVDEQDVVDAGIYGFDKTLTGPYTNPGHLGKLTTDFIKGTLKHNEDLGRAVNAGDTWAMRTAGHRVLPAQAIGQDLLDTLASPRVGIIDAQGHLSRAPFTDPKDYRTVKQMLDLFFESEGGAYRPRALNFREALDYKKRLGRPLTSYFKSQNSNPEVEIGVSRYFDGLRQMMEEVTMPPSAQGATLAANNPFIRANRAYSDWKKDLELLQRNGLDITDTSKFDDFVRDGKLLDQKVETFMKSLQHKTASSQEAFSRVADQIPVKFGGGGVGGKLGTLYDELKKYNAAQGFRNANPDFLRLGAVAGLLGVTGILDRSTAEGKLGMLGAGFLIGTPKGASILLKGGSKVANIPGNMLKATASQSARAGSKTERVGIALLSQLLRQGTHPSNTSESKPQRQPTQG